LKLKKERKSYNYITQNNRRRPDIVILSYRSNNFAPPPKIKSSNDNDVLWIALLFKKLRFE